MTAKTDHSKKRPCRDFLAALPVSDGTVAIRALSAEDADAYAAGTEDVWVKRFAHLPLDEYTPEIVHTLLKGAIADGLQDGTLAVLAISDFHSDSFLGSMVFFDITSDDAEIGYWVAPAHRGRRIACRALMLACELARSVGLKRLRARTVTDNPISERVLCKAGFERSGDVRPEVVPSGRTEMSVNYLLELKE